MNRVPASFTKLQWSTAAIFLTLSCAPLLAENAPATLIYANAFETPESIDGLLWNSTEDLEVVDVGGVDSLRLKSGFATRKATRSFLAPIWMIFSNVQMSATLSGAPFDWGTNALIALSVDGIDFTTKMAGIETGSTESTQKISNLNVPYMIEAVDDADSQRANQIWLKVELRSTSGKMPPPHMLAGIGDVLFEADMEPGRSGDRVFILLEDFDEDETLMTWNISNPAMLNRVSAPLSEFDPDGDNKSGRLEYEGSGVCTMEIAVEAPKGMLLTKAVLSAVGHGAKENHATFVKAGISLDGDDYLFSEVPTLVNGEYPISVDMRESASDRTAPASQIRIRIEFTSNSGSGHYLPYLRDLTVSAELVAH